MGNASEKALEHATPPTLTVPRLIAASARTNPNALALAAIDGDGLSYRALNAEIRSGCAFLRARGLAPGGRVAIHAANGPQLARILLVAISAGVAAPLNPGITERELSFYLEDLSPDVLIADTHSPPYVHKTAVRSETPVVMVDELLGRVGSESAEEVCREPEDLALILHTSGTTARPKQVPLTHANLCHSAYQVARAYALDAGDRCLGLMPLFHIHGIVATVLATLSTGGTLICAPRLDPERILGWVERLRPTWYTGVPTMHQAILTAASAVDEVAHALRFIRSCSAALPPSVMERLEAVFGVPVVEAYGMTEAAHQMTSNQLPPGIRKAGTVGFPTGPEVCILDGQGRMLAQGKRGEVAIRGPSVMGGYLDHPAANAESFTNGWFRTGDEGYFDTDGALVLCSRIKEIVNRGGEKISPREIDEALLEHPSVDQAVAFAVPHPTLGEDLAVAVVLEAGSSASEGELRRYLLTQLVPSKVPSRILFVDGIPKGATGKLKRIGLHEQLADQLRPPYEPPKTPFEVAVAEIWKDVLDEHDGPIGRRDNFFALGGDSLLGTRVLGRVCARFGTDISVERLFETPTVTGLANVLLGILMKEQQGRSLDRRRCDDPTA